MFLTNPSYQLVLPPALAEPGEQVWRLVELQLQLPWFLVTMLHTEEDVTFRRTFFLCWETDLIELLVSTAATRPVALQMVQPPSDGVSGWSTRSITRVWRLRDAERDDERPFVVFEGAEGACLCPGSGDTLGADFEGREVLLDLS